MSLTSTDLKESFDEADIKYLLEHLSENQLQAELRSHSYLRALEVSRRWPEFLDSSQSTLLAFGEAVKSALNILQQKKPKPEDIKGFIDVAELKNRVDILTVASSYTHLRKTGRSHLGLCPIHSEKTPSFHVYQDQQSWYCFGACQSGGDVISLIQAIEKVDFKTALTILETL